MKNKTIQLNQETIAKLIELVPKEAPIKKDVNLVLNGYIKAKPNIFIISDLYSIIRV